LEASVKKAHSSDSKNSELSKQKSPCASTNEKETKHLKTIEPSEGWPQSTKGKQQDDFWIPEEVWHSDAPTSGQSTVTNKATKFDDSKVPVHLWDRRIMAPGVKHLQSKLGTAAQVATIITVVAAATVLRRLTLRFWKRKVEKDFVVWFHGTEHITDARKDIEKRGWEATVYAQRASWWNWDGGSTMFFWRWAKEYQQEALSGVPPAFDGVILIHSRPTRMKSQGRKSRRRCLRC
jgi:hypothetical protein